MLRVISREVWISTWEVGSGSRKCLDSGTCLPSIRTLGAEIEIEMEIEIERRGTGKGGETETDIWMGIESMICMLTEISKDTEETEEKEGI
jgi:hypothetical protein